MRSHSIQAYIGDTFYHLGNVVDPLPGFQATKPMVRPSHVMIVFLLTVVRCGRGQVYAGVFPLDSNDFPKLEESIKRVSFPCMT